MILALVGSISAGLFATLVHEIPAEKRAIDEHTTLCDMVRRMRTDATAASDVSTVKDPSGRLEIVLTQRDGQVRYRARSGQVERTKTGAAGKGLPREQMFWPVPHAKVRWDVRRQAGGNVAVVVGTALGPIGRQSKRERLANVHVLFLGRPGRTGGRP
ncbi:MAG: hypothetical protein ACYS5V_06115 [Planctomycetota bacterium]